MHRMHWSVIASVATQNAKRTMWKRKSIKFVTEENVTKELVNKNSQHQGRRWADASERERWKGRKAAAARIHSARNIGMDFRELDPHLHLLLPSLHNECARHAYQIGGALCCTFLSHRFFSLQLQPSTHSMCHCTSDFSLSNICSNAHVFYSHKSLNNIGSEINK